MLKTFQRDTFSIRVKEYRREIFYCLFDIVHSLKLKNGMAIKNAIERAHKCELKKFKAAGDEYSFLNQEQLEYFLRIYSTSADLNAFIREIPYWYKSQEAKEAIAKESKVVENKAKSVPSVVENDVISQDDYDMLNRNGMSPEVMYKLMGMDGVSVLSIVDSDEDFDVRFRLGSIYMDMSYAIDVCDKALGKNNYQFIEILDDCPNKIFVPMTEVILLSKSWDMLDLHQDIELALFSSMTLGIYELKNISVEERERIYKLLVCSRGNKYIPKKEYVYIIKNIENGLFKIGYSTNPKNRISSIKTSAGVEIDEIEVAEVVNGRNVEKHLHRLFKNKRKLGEWFKLSKNDIKLAKEELENHKPKEDGSPADIS